MPASLPLDLVPILLEFLKEDNSTLCQCLLVSQTFLAASASVLYTHIRFRPNYGQTEGLLDCISSASLPRYASHVRTLSIGGYLLSDVIAGLPVADALLNVVKASENLQTIEILPDIHPDDFFTAILREVVHRPLITTLRVNYSCMSEGDSAILATCRGLRVLELKSPMRALLTLLPEWLANLAELRELHLTSNCGSVTPGFLRSLLPHLQNITAISLGLSYSLTDDDLFDFLGQLPCLESAQIQHYLQFKATENTRQMARLRSLTVLHNTIDDAQSTTRLCDWIRHAIDGAPTAWLRLRCDEFVESPLLPRTFDALLNDLASANADTLRGLDVGGWLVSAEALSRFFDACRGLEEFGAAVDEAGYEEVVRRTKTIECLHTVRLRVYSTEFIPSAEDAERIMRESRAVRRLSLNELVFEGEWTLQNRQTILLVREIELAQSEDLPEDSAVGSESQQGTNSPLLGSDDEEGEGGHSQSRVVMMRAILEEDEEEEGIFRVAGLVPMHTNMGAIFEDEEEEEEEELERYEFHIPHSFDATTPPIAFTSEHHPEPYASPSASRPPIPSLHYALSATPFVCDVPEMDAFFRGPGCPATLADFLKPNVPLLHLHVTTFEDMTFIGLTSSHGLSDAMGTKAVVSAWTRHLSGESIEEMPRDADPLRSFRTPPPNGWVLRGWYDLGMLAMISWIVQFVWALLRLPKEVKQHVCMPKVFLEAQKQRIMEEIKASGSDEWVGSSDVLLAWLLKTFYQHRTDSTNVHLLIYCNLREQKLFPTPTQTVTIPFVNHLVLEIPIRAIAATDFKSLSLRELALTIRRAIIAYRADTESIKNDLHARCCNANVGKVLFPCPPGQEFSMQSNWRDAAFGQMDFSGAAYGENANAKVVWVSGLPSGTNMPLRNSGVVLWENEECIWMGHVRTAGDWEGIRKSEVVEFR
ncbi:hypothetical protein MKEN_00415700 [Mycena kentingensis (nom. inval.)]|nr:hypothetical protein MKEN_00415700 [Mycena kentingensis (nom. inval.)]